MPTIFEPADSEVVDLMESTVKKYHPDLLEREVSVGLYMATGEKDQHGEPKGPALKLHGTAAIAIVKINSYKDRVQGKPDATIFIDASEWEKATDERRIALLDHELHHLIVAKDANGIPLSDDLGRPKLKSRPHDFQVGWFHIIAQRHGAAAYEVKQAREFADECGQIYFGWTAPPTVAVESAKLTHETKCVCCKRSGSTCAACLDSIDGCKCGKKRPETCLGCMGTGKVEVRGKAA